MVLQIFCGKISPNESEERNPMKKLTSLLLSLVLMVSVLACGASAKTSTKVRIAGLKGPTTMGLVNLLSMEKDGTADRKSTRLNSSHASKSRMPSSA